MRASALFCNEHLSLLSKNTSTPKKTRKKREFCDHSRAHIFRVSIETRLKIRTRVYACARMFLARIFSSKSIAAEEMRLFFFAFSEGGHERKKVRLSLKNTAR